MKFLHPAVSWKQSRWSFLSLQPRSIFGVLFLLSILCFLVQIPVPRHTNKHLLNADGFSYYAYVRSLVIDHDIDFTNEYAYFINSDQRLARFFPKQRTSTGYLPNKYTIGPALLWLPFFLFAHILALIGQTFHLNVVADGYGYLYQAAISLGSIVYGSAGFALIYQSIKQIFPQKPALFAIILLWLGSNAFYYFVFEPSMPHAISLFSVSLLLSTWFQNFYRREKPSFSQSIVLGLSAGLIPLVRLQDLIFLLIPYGYILLRLLRAWRTRDIQQAFHWLQGGLVALFCTFITFLPQLLTWQQLYGSWLTNPYSDDHNPPFYWLQPHIWEVLFSTFHGLFTWHPIFLLALFGFPSLMRATNRWFGATFLFLLMLNTYIVAAWWCWWQGGSFGGRMFLSAMWLWAMLLSAALHYLWQPLTLQRIILTGGLLLMLWNGLGMVQYRLGFIPPSEPLSWEQMTIERLKVPWYVTQRVQGKLPSGKDFEE